MRVEKCINIVYTNGYKVFELKDGDGNIRKIKDIELLNEMTGRVTSVINVKKGAGFSTSTMGYSWELSNIRAYKHLEGTSVSEESEKAYYKSVLLGTYSINEETGEVRLGTNKNMLVVTDRANNIKSNINIDTIMFAGNKQIKEASLVKIKCNKAIINNRCAFALLVGNPKLKAKQIVIKHDFVDLNTVNEIYTILEHTAYNSSPKELDMCFSVDFDSVGVNHEDVLARTLDIMNKSDSSLSLLASAILAHSMYESTHRKYDELLQAAKDNIRTAKNLGVLYTQEYRTIINELSTHKEDI